MPAAASGRQHRQHRGQHQPGGRPVEGLQQARPVQPAAHLLAQQHPGSAAGQVHRDEDGRQRCNAELAVGGGGGQGHGPGLGIDDLEQGRSGQAHRPAAVAGGVGSRRCCGSDPGGEVEQIGEADPFQHAMQRGDAVEHLAQAKADQDQHHAEADADAQQMGQAAAPAEVGARREQHQVVGARRDGCDEGKAGQGEQGGAGVHGPHSRQGAAEWACDCCLTSWVSCNDLRRWIQSTTRSCANWSRTAA
mmetsp:Transcript_3884/g.13754  ORF Transcript_3884/g.13754 Transcript_3884/m.13754 type:complete len:248 (+) Transcript_3884:297-1040(+)